MKQSPVIQTLNTELLAARQQVEIPGVIATHTSHLTPHTSHLTPHTSHPTPHTSHLTLYSFAPKSRNYLVEPLFVLTIVNMSS